MLLIVRFLLEFIGKLLLFFMLDVRLMLLFLLISLQSVFSHMICCVVKADGGSYISWKKLNYVSFTSNPRCKFHQCFTRSFNTQRSESSKKTDNLTVCFALLGCAFIKAACKMLMILTPGGAFLSHFLSSCNHTIIVPKINIFKVSVFFDFKMGRFKKFKIQENFDILEKEWIIWYWRLLL